MPILPDLADTRLWPAYLIALIALVVVWLFGGKPEKAALATLFAMLAVQIGLLNAIGRWQIYNNQVDGVSVVVDTMGVIGLGVIMHYADRLWTIAALSFQALALLGHVVQAFAELHGYAYVAYKTWPTMIVLSLVLVGVVERLVRVHLLNKNRDWVNYKQLREFRAIARRANL